MDIQERVMAGCGIVLVVIFVLAQFLFLLIPFALCGAVVYFLVRAAEAL